MDHNRHNVFTNTPRGNHWMGATPITRDTAYSTGHSKFNTSEDSQRRQYSGSKSEPKKPSIPLQSNPQHIVKRDSLPLISNEVLEFSKQRLLVFSIFMVIQGYKLYDLILLKNGLPVPGILLNSSYFNFITKYFIIDSMFLYFLPTFKIPRLTFKSIVVFCQIFAICAFTLFLAYADNLGFISVFIAIFKKVFFNKELSVTGASVHHNKIIDSSSHFKGALTIKILPENTAMLNPLHESYCLPMDDVSTTNFLEVPIRINSTSDIKFIQVEFRDLYTNSVETRNFSKNDIKLSKDSTSQETDLNIKHYLIPVNEIGFYQVKKILDSKNLPLKIHPAHLIVPHCPTVSLIGSGAGDRCVGDADDLSIEIHGVPPLKLSYSKIIDDQEFSYVDSNLQPEFFLSPLSSSVLSNQKSKKYLFSSNDLSDLTWARSHAVTIDLNSLTTKDGHYLYRIDKLVDSLGNTMDFNSIMSPSLRKDTHLVYEFNVHVIPRASLEEKFDSNSPTKRSLSFEFENFRKWKNDLPFNGRITYTDDDGNKESLEIKDIHSLSHSFAAELPGTYTLMGIESKFCPGVIIGKSNVLVTRPIPPNLDVKSSPIMDKCVGQIGLDFDLTFTGVPPYHFTAKIFKIENNGNKRLYDTKRLNSDGSRYQFSYNPTAEGNYEIIFDSLSNELFTDPISLQPVENFSFKTSMRVKPSAKINLGHHQKNKHLCLGESTIIPIAFKGEPPFTLDYDILEISTNKRSSYTVDKIETTSHDITTPFFEIGGDYILSLASIMDSSNCKVGLSEPDAKIHVRRDIPTASLNLPKEHEKNATFHIKQGAVLEIPLKLTGEGPFSVKYQHLDSSGNVIGTYKSDFKSNYKPFLRVSQVGRYRLIEMNDSGCPGKIENMDRQSFEVSFLERPSFAIQQSLLTTKKINKITDTIFSKETSCQGIEDKIDLVLNGSPPFKLHYEMITPNGRVLDEKIQVSTKYVSLKLPNDEPGEYVTTIKNVFDSNYQEDKGHFNAPENEIIVKQTVNPSPDIEFAGYGKTLRTCAANVDQVSLLSPIRLKVTQGKGPFTVIFNIYHESTSRIDQLTLKNVDPDNFPYQKLYEGLKLGNHDVSINKIIDSNGCSHDLIDSENRHIFISITDVPKIHLLDPSAQYCVGDYVAYQLNGLPPFTIKYDFNGVSLKSKEQSSQFVRLASEAGVISINSIQDSTSQCVVNFTKPGMESEFEKLVLNVHPIPSVTVSQGDYVIEDIHEGDQAEVIFSFEGTPPFSLTYVRTEEIDGSHGNKRQQVVETHKVTDIYAYEYRVVTSLQGTYEAIEISDAYCFAKNDAFFNNN
ncbi:hypothetical protein KAFR_0A00400 [Kazachstania africana CBS 2517]|uniref:Nucleoporin POM152 n=1 Tax=Kazachstania africana (strain ATCC 22294 / BCRC 22015 / CBS 2517 / CECT 1963 / NBRC 1671 / NRRL Y-8276) TaxID=1071382 RepID=H2AM78_KAZAF|nr:hypothetical protein KAFR_0A00400 [Kazachstania africana CBS 2517]CCF55478.1 hypothetical protein KAFR_0A00400 [Kazachstania africana CBS 2517]